MISQSAPSTLPSLTNSPQTSEVICLLNANGVVRFATPAAAAFYGYSLPGRSLLRLVTPEQVAAVSQRWIALRDDPARQSDTMLVTMINAQGQRIPIRATVWRVPGRNEFVLSHHVVEHLRDRLEALYTVLEAMAGQLQVSELVDTVLRETHRLIPCQHSALRIIERHDRIMVRRWRAGQIEQFETSREDYEPDFPIHRLMRETSAPVLIADTEADPRWVDMPGLRAIRSWLGVPLIDHGARVGELTLDSPDPNAFTDEDAQLVQALAQQVAAALRNARQFDDEQRRAKRYRALNEITQAINQLHLRDVLEVVYRQISELVDATTFFIGIHDPETRMVHLVGSYDYGVPRPDEVQRDDEGICGLVLRARQPLIIHDAEAQDVPDEIIVQDEMPRSLLMMPLITQDEIVGVITVQSYEPNAYSPDDIDLFKTIAGSVAAAVRRAHLYDQALSRLNALETLHELNVDLATVEDPDAVAAAFTRAALDMFQPGEVRLVLRETPPWEAKM